MQIFFLLAVSEHKFLITLAHYTGCLMSRSSADEIWQLWIFKADAKIEKNIGHDTICPLILSREFWFCLLVRIGQIGTYESIVS